MPLNGIREFNRQRKLITFNGQAEYMMLAEELQEFVHAFVEDNEEEVVDSLCDIIVLAVGALHKLGYNPEIALEETVKEIMSRKGEFNKRTGKWEKDKNQNPESLYKACYALAKE